jgi:hypothetical protein
MYRLTEHDFSDLPAKILDYRETNDLKPGRQSVDAKFSMILRWLAGVSYLDIVLSHCVAISTCFHAVDETLCDLDEVLKTEFPYTDREYLERVSDGFTHSRSPIQGCVDPIDGIAIRILEPCAGTTAYPSVYFNRKG